MNRALQSGAVLSHQALVELISSRLRSLPFYLVALLLHLLFVLLFGTFQISHVHAGGVTVLFQNSAPNQSQALVAPPEASPAVERVTTLVRASAPTTIQDIRPSTVSAPSPGGIAIQVPSGFGTTMPQHYSFNSRAEINAANVPSVYGHRVSPIERDKAIHSYSGSSKAESAVVRALDWIKTHQNKDGSWGGQYKTAMTGLAVLAMLAHGEHQASPHYGLTVQQGVQFLVAAGQRSKDGRLANEHVEYQHAIATYALAEDYALTHIGDLLEVLERSVALIIKSQCENGSWDYGYKSAPNQRADRPYGDTSITGWNVQALKAAKLSGIKIAGLDQSMTKALAFIRGTYDEKVRKFGYADKASAKNHDGLVGVGILCLEFLGAHDSREARGAVSTARTFKCDWGNTPSEGKTYNWYYLTQALFQVGSSAWAAWNREFRDEIIKHQRPDGSWPVPGTNLESLGSPEGQGWRQVSNVQDQPVYHTTMMCMMLETYYRFLPTLK